MRRTILLLTILLSCTSCKKLLSAALSDDDAGGIDAASVLAVVDAAPAATADAVPDAAVAARSSGAAALAGKPVPKCAKDESAIELDNGTRICATPCIDPACDCQRGVLILATGKLSSAPGDHAAFCPHKKSAKKVLPKCGPGQGLFALDEDAPPFCAVTCGTDADCKATNAKCNGPQGFSVDDKTGSVFTGVGKSVPLCGKAGPPTAASASAAPQGSATRGNSR